jgi:2-haloacid dehalogenase
MSREAAKIDSRTYFFIGTSSSRFNIAPPLPTNRIGTCFPQTGFHYLNTLLSLYHFVKMIHTIVFDLGGVLIDWNPEYVFREVIPDTDKRRFFFDQICTHDWNIEQDAGRTLAEATELLVREWPDWEREILTYYDRWEDMLGGPIGPTVDLLRELRDGGQYRLLALTNWSAETFPKALALYDFLHWFEGIVVSGEEKTRKPFADIYQILIQRYEITPPNAVFIDDNLLNVEAAKREGMQAIQFLDTAQLRRDLVAMDVK